MKRPLYSLLFALPILFISCDENEMGFEETNSEVFVLETDWQLNTPGFVSVTNQNDEILYESIQTDFNETTPIDISPGDKIDVTYGVEYNSYFKLYTSRDVKSPFELSNFIIECENDFFLQPYEGRNVKLEIENIGEYEHIYLPWSNSISAGSSIVAFDGNKITGHGFIPGSKDILVTIKLIDNDYRSHLIEKEDWINQGDDSYYKLIDFENFVTPNIHEVSLSEDDSWMVDSDILTDEGRIVATAQWRHWDDYQNGNKIKLFLPPQISIEKINLELGSGSSIEGYRYNKIFSEIPSEIDFYNPSIEIQNITSSSYVINIANPYDMAKISYEYRPNSIVSTWDIYQREEAEAPNFLPSIPSDYLNEDSLIRENLENPDNIIVEIFNFSDINEFSEEYELSAIQRRLFCLEYSSEYTSKEF